MKSSMKSAQVLTMRLDSFDGCGAQYRICAEEGKKHVLLVPSSSRSRTTLLGCAQGVLGCTAA